MISNFQKMIAYKDLEKMVCYLERMKNSEGGLKHKLRQIQTQSEDVKMRDKPRMMYVSDNNLSKYEVSHKRRWFLWEWVLKMNCEKTTHNRALTEKLTVPQLVRNPSSVQCKPLLVYSCDLVNGAYPEPENSFKNSYIYAPA